MNKCKGESRKGRKPKGGKLVVIPIIQLDASTKKSNIILHLKCTMVDFEMCEADYNPPTITSLQYNPILDPEICYASYIDNPSYTTYNNNDQNNSNNNRDTTIIIDNKDDESIIDKKIRQLKINYYNNFINDKIKKSACFWCTYPYNGINYLIPKHIIDGEEIGYGSFCCPECATAFLMKENIDDSSKFERYHLLNNKYRKRDHDINQNIKPSPDPHYMLEKFYGNLSIDEYRNLITTKKVFVIIDKPLTRILPELYEENEKLNQTFYGYNGINNVNLKTTTTDNIDGSRNLGSYKVKRQSDNIIGPSKNSIMKRHFKL